MDRATRTRLVTLGILLLVLGTGFLLGVVWDRASEPPAAEGVAQADPESRELRAEEDERPRRGARRGRRLIVHEVTGLTSDQEAEVDSVMERHSLAIGALRRELEEEYDRMSREVLMNTRGEIKAILTERQVEMYDSLLAAHDRRQAEARARKAESRDR